MESMETVDSDSGIRKALDYTVHAAWMAFCLLVLYVTLVPFLDPLYVYGELAFPYMVRFMPEFNMESVTSLQYYFSLGFMHIGYLMTIVFTYYIKKILQNSIAGRFFINDNVLYIKKAALSFAYLIVCPLSIESAIYFREESFSVIVRVLLLGYVMPWTVIGVITFIVIFVFKRIADLYEEQRLTV